MKIVTAIINSSKLDDVRDAIEAAGAHGVTVTKAKGFGRQKGHTETYRGAEYTIEFHPKLRVEVAVEDPMVDTVMQAICNAARSGELGDGKIFVTPLEKVMRIRTSEVGAEAL
ncbi:P-II family nitrogen regulator [Planctomycetes bacterium K23_9]|uniref:Nitrogen regulatory protein P-II n=1 Tax=Stieleria marina TaxID=1930275 RepID=A0A517NTR1_9BACT|nr:Nitrogen regulatory protein P-II [Planctomycetes bacterium K23_9]